MGDEARRWLTHIPFIIIMLVGLVTGLVPAVLTSDEALLLYAHTDAQ